MAINLKSANFTGTNGTHFYINLQYDLTQSLSDNSSTIKYYLYVGSSDGYSGSGGTCRGNINNSEVGTFNSIGVNANFLVGTKTEKVTHNSDGTKSVSYSASVNTPWTLGSASLSGTLNLPQITRQANLTSTMDFNDEENVTITFTNPANFRINARLEFAGTSIRRNNIPNTGTYTFVLTEEERNLLRSKCANSNTLGVRETLATCTSGTTETNWNFIDRKMTIINANPQFTSFNFADTNSTTTALTGSNKSNINNYSNIKITIPMADKAVAKKGATMRFYRIVIGNTFKQLGYVPDFAISHTINNASTGIYQVYAIDSRGNSTLVTKQSANMVVYEEITKNTSSSSATRVTNTGEATTLTYSGTIWNGSFGSQSNAITSATYKYKATTSSTWITGTTNITPTVSNGNFSFTGLIKGDTNAGFDIDNSYDVQVTIKDKLSTATFDFLVGSGKPNIAIAKEGIGIMGKYETSVGGALQINGDLILEDDSGNLELNASSLLKKVKNIEYHSMGESFTPTYDCYAEVYATGAGWGYDGEQVEFEIVPSGNPYTILEAFGKTEKHNTIPDCVASYGVYELEANNTYSFTTTGFTGASIVRTGFVKVIPKF